MIFIGCRHKKAIRVNGTHKSVRQDHKQLCTILWLRLIISRSRWSRAQTRTQCAPRSETRQGAGLLRPWRTPGHPLLAPCLLNLRSAHKTLYKRAKMSRKSGSSPTNPLLTLAEASSAGPSSSAASSSDDEGDGDGKIASSSSLVPDAAALQGSGGAEDGRELSRPPPAGAEATAAAAARKPAAAKKQEEDDDDETHASAPSPSPSSSSLVYDSYWNTMFENLVAFKAKFGHCCVPRSYQLNGKPRVLGAW